LTVSSTGSSLSSGAENVFAGSTDIVSDVVSDVVCVWGVSIFDVVFCSSHPIIMVVVRLRIMKNNE
jgi:hypothetical protein